MLDTHIVILAFTLLLYGFFGWLNDGS